MPKNYKSHGTGAGTVSDFKASGENIILEEGVLIFHPENISMGDNIYVGHQTILKGYYKNEMKIGSNTWIGQQCFFHAAGGIDIGESVGIGPGVKILTSTHQKATGDRPIIEEPISFRPVVIGSGSDIGVGAIILPGVTIGENCQIGAGAVVTKSIPNGCTAAGVPAVLIGLSAIKTDRPPLA